MLNRTRMRFLDEESGQDTVEYGLLAAFISVFALLAIKAIGPLVNAMYEGIANAISGGVGGGQP